jgi:DNA-directed RNA polymerase II subunit RPB2
MNKDELPWKIIDTFFKDDPQNLVRHHIDSFNDFYNIGLKKTINEMNPIKLQKEQDEKTGEFKLKCFLFVGGKDASKIYYGKPIIYDENRQHYMFPNEARMRNMTYGMTIHVDVEVDFEIIQDSGDVKTHSIVLDKIYLGIFPIMLQSDFCILSGLSPSARYNMGECKNDNGGYFIIDGKEKVIISQEKFANNMLYIRDKV